MDIQDSLSTIVTSSIERVRKKDPLATFFKHYNTTLYMHIFCDVSTKVIKLMFIGHVLNFEKTKEVLEGLIIHCGTSFLNK
jgi:hypothetical protein